MNYVYYYRSKQRKYLLQAVLLYQCLQSLDQHSIEGLTDFINELKTAINIEPARKGVKAQKVGYRSICRRKYTKSATETFLLWIDMLKQHINAQQKSFCVCSRSRDIIFFLL